MQLVMLLKMQKLLIAYIRHHAAVVPRPPVVLRLCTSEEISYAMGGC